MTLSERIAEVLAAAGITHAFGIVGGGNVALWDAIARLGKTEIISVHHEQAAVMAAAAYWRTGGRIAAALVTTGAGSTNAITGAMSAWMDSRPVLILSGNDALRDIEQMTRVKGTQAYDSSGLAKGFTKYAARLDKPEYVGLIEFALHEALDPRRGPCWLDIPKDVQRMTAA